MSFVLVALALAAMAALANAQCVISTSGNFVLNTPNAYNTISASSSASATCLPGYVMSDASSGGSSGSSGTTFSITCSSSSSATVSGTYFGGTCTKRQDWCPSNINANFGNTTTVTAVFARSVDSTVRLVCKPAGLGRNWRGNGTSIQVTCASLADGSGGVWVSDDWCSGALGVSANIALLALAAVAGLLYKRFF